MERQNLSRLVDKIKMLDKGGREAAFRITVFAAVIILLLVFLFNLFKTNKPVDNLSGKEIDENISSVKGMSANTTVDALQTQLAAMEDSGNEALAASVKGRFMKKFANCMVVGDSLTEGLPLYGYLTDEQVVSKIGASVLHGEDMFDKAASARPAHVFLAFGMNDMGNYSGDEKSFVKRYSKLIDDLMKKSPKTKVYVCSISTPTEDAIKDNSSIGNYAKFNEAIKKMCKTKKLTFIDISKLLPDHPQLYAPDGIHADSTYYPLWLDKMAEAAGL